MTTANLQARYEARKTPADQWFDALKLAAVLEHQCPKCPQLASLDCATEDGGCTVVCASNPKNQSYEALQGPTCDYSATLTPDEVIIAVLFAEEFSADDSGARGEEELQCLNEGGSTPCRGPVENRLRDDGKSFPRCEGHWEKRQQTEQDLRRRFPISAPRDFSPDDAGESWDGE